MSLAFRLNSRLIYSAECGESQFTCDDGQCVSATVTCNGVKECGDGSDEAKVCTHLQTVGLISLFIIIIS